MVKETHKVTPDKRLPLKRSRLPLIQPLKRSRLPVKQQNVQNNHNKLPIKKSILPIKQTMLPIRHTRQYTKPSRLLNKEGNMTFNASINASINASNNAPHIAQNNASNNASNTANDQSAATDKPAKDEKEQPKDKQEERQDTTASEAQKQPKRSSDGNSDTFDPEKKIKRSIDEVVDTQRVLVAINKPVEPSYKVNVDQLPAELAVLYRNEKLPDLSARLSIDGGIAKSSEVTSAMERIKHNFVTKTVERELDDLYCLYLDTRKKTIYQNKQLAEYNDRIETLQTKINNDPSRRKAVYIAHQYGSEKDELEKEKEAIKHLYEDQCRDMQLLTEVNARLAKDKNQAYHTNTESQKNILQMEMQMSKLENEKMRLKDDKSEKERMLRKAISENHAMNMKLQETGSDKRDSSKDTDNSSFKKILEMTIEKQKGMDKRLNDTVFKNNILLKLSSKQKDVEKTKNKEVMILKGEVRMRKKAFLKIKSLSDSWKKKAKTRYEHLDLLMTDHNTLQKDHDINRKHVNELQTVNGSLIVENRRLSDQANSVARNIKEKEAAISDLKTIGDICFSTKQNLDGIIKSNGNLIKSLKQSAHVYEMQLSNTKSKLTEKTDISKHCSKLYSRADAEVKHLAQENVKKDNVITLAGQELQRMVNKVAEMAEQVKTYETHYHDIQMVVEKLEKETNGLAKRFEVLGRNKHMLVKKNQQLFHESENLQEQITNMDYESNIKDSTIQTMAFNDSRQQHIFHDLTTQIERAEKEIYQHSILLAARDAINQTLKTEVKLSKVEMERMSIEIEQLKQECRQERIMRKDMLASRDTYANQGEQHRLEKLLQLQKVKSAITKLREAEIIVNSKLSDVKVLCTEVKELRKTLKNHATVKLELQKLKANHVELGRCHVQTLGRLKGAEEMGPQNVHKLRYIKAKNSSTYELHVKIQHMTKRLINKSSEIVEKEQLLIEKNKLYMELKTMVSIKFPSIELRQNMERLKELNKKKDRQLKALKAELNLLEGSQASVDNKMAMKDQELRELKEKYLKQKGVNDRSSHNNNIQKRNISPVKMLGGGYNTATPHAKRTLRNKPSDSLNDKANMPSIMECFGPSPTSPNPMKRTASPRSTSGLIPKLPPLRAGKMASRMGKTPRC